MSVRNPVSASTRRDRSATVITSPVLVLTASTSEVRWGSMCWRRSSAATEASPGSMSARNTPKWVSRVAIADTVLG